MNVFCLSHNPGVSKAILDAAGPTVENECKNLGKDHSISQAKPLNIFFIVYFFNFSKKSESWGITVISLSQIRYRINVFQLRFPILP